MIMPENPSFAAARLILDEAARSGITDVVIAPGSRSTALALAFYEDERFIVHTQLDERSAGFYALGYAKITGRAMPIVVTSGSAVAQLHPAVIEADAAGVPVLVISADRPAELRDTGANQTIRQAGLFGDATRFATHVDVLADHASTNRYLRSVMQHALAAAHGGATRPGPVQLNVAFREPTVPVRDDGRADVTPTWQQPLAGRDDNRPWIQRAVPVREPHENVIATIAAACAGRRGVIVGGTCDGGVDEHALIAAVDRLARLLDWPVFAEGASVLRRCETAVPHLSHLLAHDTFVATYAPDVVLRFGRTGITAGLDRFLRHAAVDVLVDPYGSVFDADRHITDMVVADLPRFVAGLSRVLHATNPSPGPVGLLDGVHAAARAVTGAVDTVLQQTPWLSEPATLRHLGAHLDAEDVLVVGSSMPIRDFDTYAPHPLRVPVVANRGASGIDGFVSTVLGVAAGRNRFTVGVCGDVTFLHDINGLLAQTTTSVAIVVIDNDGGAIFSFLPQAAYPEALRDVFTMPHGRDLRTIASGYGAFTCEAMTATDLDVALCDARTRAGVTIIRVPSNGADNVVLHRTLRAAAHAAMDG